MRIEIIECKSDSLDITDGIWNNDEYYFYDYEKTLNWSPAATGMVECGAVSWELTMDDTSPIDPTIFTADFTGVTKELKIYSGDTAKAGLYDLKVTAYYDR